MSLYEYLSTTNQKFKRYDTSSFDKQRSDY